VRRGHLVIAEKRKWSQFFFFFALLYMNSRRREVPNRSIRAKLLQILAPLRFLLMAECFLEMIVQELN